MCSVRTHLDFNGKIVKIVNGGEKRFPERAARNVPARSFKSVQSEQNIVVRLSVLSRTELKPGPAGARQRGMLRIGNSRPGRLRLAIGDHGSRHIAETCLQVALLLEKQGGGEHFAGLGCA